MKGSPHGESQQTCPTVATGNLQVELYIQGGRQMAVSRKRSGAPPTPADWDSIDWPRCRAVVKKLQVRIAKAVRLGRWNKVKSLQRLLTASYSAKVLAIRKVTQNKGKNTPEVDGMLTTTAAQKSTVI